MTMAAELTVLLINKHFDRAIEATVQLASFCPTGAATVWTLAGTALDANTGTEVIEPGVTFAPQITVEPDGRFNLGSVRRGFFELVNSRETSTARSLTRCLHDRSSPLPYRAVQPARRRQKRTPVTNIIPLSTRHSESNGFQELEFIQIQE